MRVIPLSSDHLYQQNLRSFLTDIEWANPYAVTLTMSTSARLDPSQNFRHFLNRLNQSYLGNRYRRHGQPLRVFPVIEGTESTPAHYHCVIDNPFPNRTEDFYNAIQQAWWKTALGKPELNIKPMNSNGWLTYITKRRTKTNYTSCVDWQNTHL